MKTGLSSSRPRKPSQSRCPSYLHQGVLSLFALQNFAALAAMPRIRGRELVCSDVGEMEKGGGDHLTTLAPTELKVRNPSPHLYQNASLSPPG